MRTIVLSSMLLLTGILAASDALPAAIPMRITEHVLHPLPSAVFGHFMERATFGEPGYEVARLPGTRTLDPRAVAIMREWRIPLIRFPAGTDLSWIDWRDMIDHAPGRDGPRPPFVSGHPNAKGPLSNEFGIDEFLALCREIDAVPLLPLPLDPGLSGWITPEALALRNAGLVAYCNAKPGAVLPAGMPDWGAVRAANGHPEPYGVRYFQLGNEVWSYWQRAMDGAGIAAGVEARYAWYRRVLDASIAAMRAVDPTIELIMEGRPAPRRLDESAEVEKRLREDADLRAQVGWVTYHDYRPMGMGMAKRGETEVDPQTLSPAELWYLWVAAAPRFDEQGQAQANWGKAAADLGWKIAVTEWNWNGWWTTPAQDQPGAQHIGSLFAKGVGAAATLHGLMRHGSVGIACQSMLVGNGWDIAGIHYGKASGGPQRMPSGMVVGLYAAHHGDRVVELERPLPDTYAQPLRLGWLQPQEKVAYLDVICTRSDDAWFLHIINRRFDRAERIALDLSVCGAVQAAATHRILEGTLDDVPIAEGSPDTARVRSVTVPVADGRLVLEVPERSVSVLELRRR